MRRKGFTLIELLVVVGVLSILVAFTLPALSSSRAAARHAGTLATLREHLAVMALDTQDFRDTYHSPDVAPSGRTTLRPPGRDAPYTIHYFGLSSAWPVMLAPYYGDTWPHPSHTFPGRSGTSRYLYSCAMIADPAFWNPATRRGPSQWRGTRTAEVRYPAQKALLTAAIDTEPYPPWITDGLLFGRCDAAAGFCPKSRLRAPIDDGDGPFPGLAHVRGYSGLDTFDGVHGIDVQP